MIHAYLLRSFPCILERKWCSRFVLNFIEKNALGDLHEDRHHKR